jgi:hypothetical protein
MTSPTDPFAALGLPTRPDLTDEQVRTAWRTVAAATHPDRPGGGNPAKYAAASAAYAVLRTAWGRSEAYADLMASRPPGVSCRPPAGPSAPSRAAAHTLRWFRCGSGMAAHGGWSCACWLRRSWPGSRPGRVRVTRRRRGDQWPGDLGCAVGAGGSGSAPRPVRPSWLVTCREQDAVDGSLTTLPGLGP